MSNDMPEVMKIDIALPYKKWFEYATASIFALNFLAVGVWGAGWMAAAPWLVSLWLWWQLTSSLRTSFKLYKVLEIVRNFIEEKRDDSRSEQ